MKSKIVFNEISIGFVSYVHDHMIDAIRDDGVECERYTGITPQTQWLSYTVPNGIISVSLYMEDWQIQINTNHYETYFTIPRDQVHNISIF